jgi:hypothetical protein
MACFFAVLHQHEVFALQACNRSIVAVYNLRVNAH